MKSGKVPVNVLKDIVMSTMRKFPDELVVGPKIGEDAAVIRLEDGYQVIASDPVTGAAKNIGYHSVYVNSNDVAATGADPKYMTVTILLNQNATKEDLMEMMEQINEACRDIGAFVVGGHTEMVADLSYNIVCGTMIGFAKKYVATSNAKPGDNIIMTKGTAIEGTSILAHKFEEKLSQELGPELVQRAKSYSKMLSILPEARLLREYANSMHDPTEGGIAGALNELAIASECGFNVDREKMPISPETSKICEYFSCDPLTLISSGTLLATIPDNRLEMATKALDSSSIKYSIIGKITKSGVNLPMPEQDSLWDII